MTPNSNAIEQFNTLTPAHQQQAIDFIAFLKAREQVVAPTGCVKCVRNNGVGCNARIDRGH
jgi:hypothetical protein